ncbi:hypothetical protein ABE021_06025 [Sporosarcina gallistercoris]|uniref:hypothetical protein n=1 Tax=Sporosarcina gallistercoris TaxID=2762245 RepID=UPI003D26EA6F
MEHSNVGRKRVGKISYTSLMIGIVCFFIVFVPATRIANAGIAAGDLLTILLTVIGIALSIIGIASQEEKKAIPILSLILSSSFLIFWAIVMVLLVTGQMDFAP